MKHTHYIIKENEMNYLIIRDLSVNPDNISELNKENLTIVFDFNNFSKELKCDEVSKFLDLKPKNLKIVNCLVNSPSDMYKNKDIELDILYISDELYSMSPYLKDIFPSFKTKKLILKKIKINSKLQLSNFLNFIIGTQCEELFLEDIFIELLIKKDEKDTSFNELEQYITFENGKFFITLNNEKKESKLKGLKMIDCPLFALSEDTFKNIIKYKDISIDIDENSLLNPSIITKFKINKGISDLCFDLDSLKLNEEENEDDEDYIKNLEYLFKIIIDDNHEFNKLTFKNFDITKYEYITGENLTFIDEKKWVLNDKEKQRKKNFEDFDEKINKEIENNKDILSKVKGLVFDNCTNYFIQLILKFINSTNNNLDILKIKKCGKEHFEIKNILNLKINKLILFDTPLSIDEFPKDIKGEIENLTININSLEHYCKENNLNYYKTLEIIIELIKNEKFNKNLCFEMNALPIIMTYLAAKEYHKIKKIKGKFTIPNYFEFKSSEERQQLIEKNDNTSPFIIEGLAGKDKTIILKNNSIKNKFENYDIIPINTKNREQKIDFGRDKFDIDIDYRTFLNVNQIKTIIMEDCLINNYFEPKLKEESLKNNTLINIMSIENKKNFKIDIKTLNESIYKGVKAFDDYDQFFKEFIKVDINSTEIGMEFKYIVNFSFYFGYLKNLFENLNKYTNELTIIFDDIKERKEFYCLLIFFEKLLDENNYTKYSAGKNKIKFLNVENLKVLKKFLSDYYIKENNEEGKLEPSVFNYYYTSDDELKRFGEPWKEEKEAKFGSFKFKIEYRNSTRKDGDNANLSPWNGFLG